MALLDIRTYGDPVLERVAEAVDAEAIDDGTRSFINDMLDTMRDANGIGLAAPQVGVSKRIAVVQVEGEVLKMINPRITMREGKEKCTEGCLSLPDIEGEVVRAVKIRVEFLDEWGNERCVDASGLLARCIQHELDHLDGILFVKWVGKATRLMLRKRLNELKKRTMTRLEAGA